MGAVIMKNDIGAILSLSEKGPDLNRADKLGIKCCQLCSWLPELWTDDMAALVNEEVKAASVRITAFWAGYTGPRVWNFTEGPSTLGIVPVATREQRVTELKLGASFAKKIGAPAIITHLGFIPENPADPAFEGIVDAVRRIADYCRNLGLEFWFETGQETPVTLLRLIECVGTGNLGINLDPANLIMYGKGNPIDSLDVFGRYVKNVHVKDGLYPVNPMELGREVKVGEGKVCFPMFILRLKEAGFTGEYIIEREVRNVEEQNLDIISTIAYLKKLI